MNKIIGWLLLTPFLLFGGGLFLLSVYAAIKTNPVVFVFAVVFAVMTCAGKIIVFGD